MPLANESNSTGGEPSLGLVELPDNTFEHDLAVSERYQSFSTELLRLSLLGIAAIGFLIANILLKGAPQSGAQANIPGNPFSSPFKYLVSGSLICFGLSAGCALLHGYVSAATVARHLRAIRLELRRAKDEAEEEKEKRASRLRLEIRLNFASGVFLWLGAVLLAASFIVIV
jgi:hypothetical protein